MGKQAIDTWQEKLEFLQVEEATASDPAQKFQLRKQIAEAKEKIAELQKVVDVLPEEANAIVGAMEDYQMLLKSSIEVSHKACKPCLSFQR